FPFTVQGSETSIALGAMYDLVGSRIPANPPDGSAPVLRWEGSAKSQPIDVGGGYSIVIDSGNYVKVTDVQPNSFTFTTLPGHFDGPGATITFQTTVENGHVIFQQIASAPDAGWFESLAAPVVAQDFTWKEQAKALEKDTHDPDALEKGSQFIADQTFGVVSPDASGGLAAAVQQ